ncbi:MAG: DNA polymerase I [Anaerolineae bacterium]|nr:DNA polymerase I [Anaerolineae bacterium]
MPETLYLIDGHALAYRMYFALMSVGGERFTTKSGEPTAGTYGFTQAVMRLLEQEKPEYLAVAFDVGKTFRDDLFPEYKGTREKMPDDLRLQIERIQQIVDAFGFPRLEVAGFEADDVLGSVARYAVSEGLGVKIITGDRDLLQLVDDRVIVNLPGRKTSDTIDYTAHQVKEYMGVRPDQIVDYKALAGDSSDNIPGVPGVGDKTAKNLLEQFDSLDGIYAHLDDVPARYRAKLEEGKQSAYLSYDLARIRTDVTVSIDLEAARTNRINFDAVKKLFHELEFQSLMQRLENLPTLENPYTESRTPMRPGQLSLFEETPRTDRIGVAAPGGGDTIVVQDLTALDALVQVLNASQQISLDTETTSTDPMLAELVGISLSVTPGEGYYIPVGHHGSGKQLSIETVRKALQPSLTNPGIQKVGHHLKYDVLVLERHGFTVSPLSFDTMLAQWILTPAIRGLGLKTMAEEILGVQMTHIEDLIGSGKDQKNMADVAIEEVAPYAAADADIPLRLREVLEPQLREANAVQVFETIEMPLIPILIEMEREGILLDVGFLKQMDQELAVRQAELTENIFRAAGFEFNLNSTQQLADVLFDTLGLTPPPRTKKTSSGKYSTNAGVLEAMSGKHPVVDWVLEYRELSKLSSTYLQALPQEVNPTTGRVHSSFSQTVAVTGRLSSSNPNLQNIPTRTDLGRQVRKAFIAGPGKLLLAMDYSQIELRIVAHLAQDESMLRAFRAGQDIHAATAAAVYGVPLKDVNPDMRRHAKAINFGLIYGMSSFGLSQSTGLTVGEADTFVNAYFKQFPGVKRYLDGIRESAAMKGYVETMYGRRRYFPNLKNERNSALRNREEREAINAPIQGTAADIIKVAMIRLLPALGKAGLKARLLLQIHDELLLECPESEVNPTLDLLREVMENAIELPIPLTTEAKVGLNWAEMEKVQGKTA